MTLLHDINNNILISHPSYSGVYQDRYEKWELHQEINDYFGWNQKQSKTAETVVNVTPSILNTHIYIYIYKSHIVLKGGWVSWDYILTPSPKNGCINVHHKMGIFSSVLWCLQITICKMMSVTSHVFFTMI